MNVPRDEDLHAWIDGRLDAAHAAIVAEWLAAHPEAAARVESWRAQKALLHAAFDPVLDEPLPEHLAAPLARHAATPSLLWFQNPFPLRLVAGLAIFALGLTGGYLMRGLPTDHVIPQASLARSAAIAHAVYAPEVRHPVEVGAEQSAHLVQWLSKRLEAPLRVPDFSPHGFALVGGRLLPGETGPVAQMMYQNTTGQRVTLYLRREAGSSETAFRHAEEGGLGVFYWVDGGFGYALSGELERAALLQLATTTFQQFNP